MKLHRIRLDDGQWADVHDVLTFGMRLDVREAATRGPKDWNLTRVQAYVSDWSFDGSPADAEYVQSLPDIVLTRLLNSAEEHYEEALRTAEERFRDQAAAGVSDWLPAGTAGHGPTEAPVPSGAGGDQPGALVPDLAPAGA